MRVLSKIRQAGFTVSLIGDDLEIRPASALTQNQREFLKSHKMAIVVELRAETPTPSATDCQWLLDYLAAIGEHDEVMMDELLAECTQDTNKLTGVLQWADKVLATPMQPRLPMITCHTCTHFRSYYKHGGGAGRCAVGMQPSGVCWWADTEHECLRYKK
jgi:hypothetical protein